MVVFLSYLKNILTVLVFTVPFILLLLHQYTLTSLSKFKVFFIITIVVYVLALCNTWAVDAYLKAVLDGFDINANGVFDADEISPAQSQAMQDVINDTNRRFAAMTGLIFAPIYTAMCCGVYWLGLKFGRLTQKH